MPNGTRRQPLEIVLPCRSHPSWIGLGRGVWYLLHRHGSRHCHLAIGHCTIRQRVFDCKYLSCKICFNVLNYVFILFITDRPARSAAMPVLFLLSGPKMGFSPHRGDPKLSKFRILAINLPLRGHSFAHFFTKFADFVRISRWILHFLLWLLSGYKQPSYKHFPAVEAFSLKFSIAHSGETTYRIKQS